MKVHFFGAQTNQDIVAVGWEALERMAEAREYHDSLPEILRKPFLVILKNCNGDLDQAIKACEFLKETL